ncbi:MAG: Xaa-Pro peptidase family protein [Elusimicrobiota bacterium]
MITKRFDALKKLLKKNALEYFFDTQEINSYYLTGFKGNVFPVLAGLKSIYLFVPPMLFDHVSKSKNLSEAVSVIKVEDSVSARIKRIIGKGSIIGFNPDSLSVAWQETLGNISKCKKAPGIIEELRAKKDTCEINNIKKACSITGELAGNVNSLCKDGITEKELSKKIDMFFMQKGDGKAFDTIVAYGSNTQFPHHEASLKRFDKHSILLIDCGAKINGYCSDLTRVYFLDRIKRYNNELNLMFNFVNQAKKSLIAMVKPGIKTRDIDLRARSYAKDAGLLKYYLHGTGHGVGLEIHEKPFINQRSTEVLQENMVITIEPGVYMPGIGGVRLEDTVLVTKNGAKILTV